MSRSTHGRHVVPLALSLMAMLALAPGPGRAADLERPAGRVLLRVTGAIEKRNDGDAAVFDRAMLEALPQTTVRTTTPWTEGVTEFRGPLGRVLLERVGTTGSQLNATAINVYTVSIPVADFREHDVIIALTRDGKPMRVRDRGPLWVIYPWSDEPQLRTEVHHGRSIWQLKAIAVE